MKARLLTVTFLLFFILPALAILSPSPVCADNTIVAYGSNYIDIDYGNGTHGFTTGVVNRWNGSAYEPCNTTLVASNDAAYSKMMNKALYEVYFKNDSYSSRHARFKADGYVFDFDIGNAQAQYYNSVTKAVGGGIRNPAHTTISVSNNEATYVNSWTDTNLTYSLMETGVKETIVMASVPANTSNMDYFRYRINVYYNNSLGIRVNGNYYLHPSSVALNTTGRIEFLDATNKTVFYIPEPLVWDSAGNVGNVTKGDAIYFLSLNNGVDLWYLGVSKTFLDNATFPVYLDPSTYYGIDASGNDGQIESDYSNGETTGYAVCWSGTGGATLTTTDSYSIMAAGQFREGALHSYSYVIDRAFLKFNTTSLPSSATVSVARLDFWVTSYVDTPSYALTLQNWTGDTAIGTEDWALNGTATIGSTSNWNQNGFMNITISDTTWIVKAGYTKGVLRGGDDVAKLTQTGTDERINIATFDNGNATRNPKLYIEYTANAVPTISAVTGTNWDDTDNCYAQKKSYTCSVTYTDTDGYADIHYCELYLQSSSNTTRAQFQYHEDDDTVSTITGSSTWTLDSTASDFSRSGTDIMASWKFTAQWDATAESDLDFLFYVVDDQPEGSSSTSDQNFDVITTLTTSGLASDDGHINKAGTATISGTAYYANAPGSTTSSSSYPPNAEFTSVSIHDPAGSVQATDSTIMNGAFSGSFTIPDAAQSNTYHVYINMADADYVDSDAGDGDVVSVIGDALAMTNLQTVQYIGSGNYRYQAQVTWAYNSNIINGASVNVSNPSGVTLSALTSNSTGWVNFVISQSNGTVGTFTIFGVNDNSEGITTAGTNQTFALLNWTLSALDNGGNALTGTTASIVSASTTVWSGTPTNIYVPSANFNVTLTWNTFTVNTTSNVASQTGTQTFKCTVYPYVKGVTRYWVGGNATVTSATYTSDLLVLKFSGSVNTYSLVATCPDRPSFILNCSYNYDTDWTTYLTLTHYANTTISIAYYSWSDTYIQEVSDARLVAAAWIGETLHLDFEGTTGDTGRMVINCGGRGSPEGSTGFDSAVYSGGTRDFTCQMIFASTVSASVTWLTDGGGGGDGGTGGNIAVTPSYLVRADFSAVNLKQGERRQITGSVIWTGPTIIYVYGLSFVKEEQASWFTIENLPITLTRNDMQGEGTFPVTLTVPYSLKPGEYNIPCTILMRTDTSAEFSTDAIVKFTLAQAAGSASGVAPEMLTVLFLVGFAIILMTAFLRSGHSPIRKRK